MTDHLFVLSAANQERLQAYARRVLAWLESPDAVERFSDAIYTWQVGRTALKRRLAIAAGGRAELQVKLAQWLEGEVVQGTWIADAIARDGTAGAPQADPQAPLVEAALARKDLPELAALWTTGADLDWRKLHEGIESGKRRRISVPTYPFARERHWIDLGATGARIAAHVATPEKVGTPGEYLFVTPAWQATRAPQPRGARDAGDLFRHHVLLCEMPGLDAEQIESAVAGSECCHLRDTAQSDDVAERFIAYAVACFDQLRAILAAKPRGKVLCQLVIPDEPEAALLAGLSGMLRTAGQENPQLLCQIILADADTTSHALARVLEVEKARLEDGIIRYSAGKRHVLTWRDVPTRAEAPAHDQALPTTFRDDGVYLVTGGLGGLGTLFVREILQCAVRPRIIVTGRGPAAPRNALLETLSREAVERGAVPIEYRELDLASRADVRGVIASIEQRYQRLSGIIHCAGMVSDAFILNKDREEIRRVLAPKVLGTVNLDEATREIDLDFLVLFSSAVSVTGNSGQADYAAANGFMDHFAHWRNRLVERDERRGHTLSINWPLWLEGGMVMDAARVASLRQSVGVVPMRTAIGMRVFHESLAARCGRALVMEGELPRLRALLARTTTSSATLVANTRVEYPALASPAPAAAAPAPAARAVAVATATLAPQQLQEETLKKLRQLLGEVIKRPAAQIDAQEELSAYGIDSIIINTMNFRLTAIFGEISKTLFFEYKTLKDLGAYLVGAYASECAAWTGVASQAAPAEGRTPAEVTAPVAASVADTVAVLPARARAAAADPIAIVGISGIYPRSATLEEFWANLAGGENCVGEIPRERWALEDFYTPDIDQAVEQRKSYSKWGGFIDQFAEFDPLFFNISPREAMNMDPQERLFLQECWRALEDAGYTRSDLKHRFGQRVGVFAGITKSGFNLHAAQGAADPQFLPYTSFGSTANRVSYLMDITGPSMPVDTMCSSSLTAIHEACEYIRRGDCEMAFAGGVNLYLHPYTYQWLCQQRMLSRDGLCRSFGAGGSGYVPGEGVGVVLLKSLSSAIRDQDHIHGVILASHVNHSGKTSGYTVPNPNAQAELIRGTLDKAGIKARDVSYIEAHGTGTELGDPIEITGLTQAFSRDTSETGFCRIGSAKSNIGHLEAAAGIAALTKVLLQMKHRQIAPSLHATRLNPNIAFDKTAFRVNTELSPWLTRTVGESETPRIAGISSFGAGGANCHILVQEYRAPAAVRASTSGKPSDKVIVPLSARSPAQLISKARDLEKFIRAQGTWLDLASVACTLQTGREAMDERVALLVSSVDELAGKLRAFVAGTKDIDDLYRGQGRNSGDTVRLFGDDDDFAATIERWMARRKLARLAEVWTRGVELDWSKLYDAGLPPRIGLPTYPFAKEKYWVDSVQGTAPVARPAVAAVLHPLLHRNTSVLGRQTFTSVFTGDESFLRDHRVKGGKVLPAVAYLEMARAAVERSAPDEQGARIIELRDTVWAQPIAVAGPTEVTLGLSGSPESQIEFEVSTASAVHCEGRAALVSRPAASVLDLARLQDSLGAGATASALYASYAAMGIDYGPAHRAVEALWVGDGQVLARLRLPQSIESSCADYLLHPSLLDGALQACIALAGVTERARPMLPFALDTLRVFAPCTREMFAWVRPAGDIETRKYDVDLCDSEGRVCAQLHGFVSRVLEGELAPAARAAAIPEPVLHSLVPVWSRVSAGHDATPQRVLLVGCEPEALAWLHDAYRDAEFLQISPNASVPAIQQALAGRCFDRLLWIAPQNAKQGAHGDDDLIASQQQGVLAVFRLAKALLNLGYGDKALHWTLITRNTQCVRGAPIAPAHSAVVGFAGSLAKEFPEWNVSLVDVDDLRRVDARECLAWDGRAAGVLACRQGEWFSQGLARVTCQPETPAPYRQQGVYVVIGGAGGIGTAWSRFMIERFDARIVWIGRRESDAAIEENIHALGRLGHAPMYLRADATQRESLQRAFDQIRKIHPRIHGVVHSAIDLKDQSFTLMEEATFSACLGAKVDTSVNMHAVFGGEDLDFMLFFSSLISFTRAAGQSNYSAGCTFADSFAHSLAQRHRYPVKIMNWGYWGNVGIVTGDFYNERMRQKGVGSIEADEAMESLQALVGSDIPQLALLKTLDQRALDGVALPEAVAYLPRRQNVLPRALGGLDHEPRTDLRQSQLPAEAVELAGRILAATLASLRIASVDELPRDARANAPWLARWLATSLEYLVSTTGAAGAAGDRAGAALEAAWAGWDAGKQAWLAEHSVAAQVALVEACMRALPQIISGTQRATDVMFPDSSMHLVEGVYKGHALADYANDVLGATLAACISQSPGASPVRILEIGAGTGGTTARILPLLRAHSARIAEYCYTDLSKAFLSHAEQHYRPQFPALTTAIFDVTRPVQPPLEAHGYDFVIATNVLHATPDIRETLRNAKALLKSGGVLLLNEMSTWSLFSHLTFGLLEGWWLYEDAKLRLAGSPGLAPQSWDRVLTGEGFESIAFPAAPAHEFGHQVIAAASDGCTRQRIAAPAQPLAATPVAARVAPDATPEGTLRDRLLAYLKEIVAKHLRLVPAQVDAGRALAEYGLDSIIVVGLTNQLRKAFPAVKTTLFFEVRNIGGLADYLLERHSAQAAALLTAGTEPSTPPTAAPHATTATPTPTRELARATRPARAAAADQPRSAIFDVAIVGLSGRYPQAPDLGEFWRNLASGRNCITEIPQERWDWKSHFDPEKGKPGKIYTRWGGFLEHIDRFDPLFFRIAPKEAKVMDPQERLFLEACYHAIEDAGYTPENVGNRDKVGVFVGVMNARYAPQPLYYSIANRVSFLFDFQGPSMAVDTACSASLTAIHLALESLYSGLTECAIAGGVNLIIDSGHYEALSSLTMLSSGNECRSFGNDADGFVDAEGVGAVVLKPLAKAEQDGDHIYGVIKASAINAGGKTNGYTVPNPLAQSAVVSKALERAGLDPADISYVEAHGTGTALGDPVEVAGLSRVFGGARADGSVCALGSLKSNIGHCEAAAGIAGLTKVLLQLEHQQLVPSLHSEVPNPEIDFSQTPFRVQKTLAEWPRPRREIAGTLREIPRIAGISSFGAGGANAHVIVQEYEPAPRAAAAAGKVVIPLSARTADELRQKARALRQFMLDAHADLPDSDLRDVAYTLQVGRESMEERLGLVVSSARELVENLESFCKGGSGAGLYQGRVKRHQEIVSSSTEGPFTERDLPRLVELWVKGFRVDWHKLHGAQKPRRVRLPVYPFGGERYWHEPERAAAKPSAIAVLHPLLHRNVSDIRQQCYRSTFTGGERFLTNQKLIPGAVFLEMARAAIENASASQLGSHVGREHLELFNIVWADPVAVETRRDISVALFARDEDQLDYEIFGPAPGADHDVVHAQGQAILRRDPELVRLDLDRLRLEARDGHLLAELPVPAAGAAHETLVLDPLVIDAALRAAGELMSVSQPSLPLALESLRILRPGVGRMFAWIRPAQEASADAPNFQLDIDFADSQGNVCVQMRGLTYERAPRDVMLSAPAAQPLATARVAPKPRITLS